jgi:disulfide oxidoreductase YuzD
MDKLGIHSFNFEENSYERYDLSYDVKDIIELSKKNTEFKLPIKGIDISVMPWGKQNIKKLCYHIKRINSASMDYPIILDNEGYICDGWHRLVKAIINGDEYIRAIRLTVMPEPMNK